MKALVTGGDGFVGSHLVQRLRRDGHKVVVLDRGSGDVRIPAVVHKAAAGCDVIFHLAAVVGVGAVLKRGAVEDVVTVNVNGTLNALQAARWQGCRVVFTSTSEVAGKANPPFAEDGDRVMGPTSSQRWVYAETKALGEHLCLEYAATAGVPVSVVRPFNVYGPRLEGRVVTRFARQILAGEPVTVIGDGRQTRCFTYVSDLVDGLLLASDHPDASGQVFNLGNPTETSMVELVDQLGFVCGRHPQVQHVAGSDVYGSGFEDIARRVPDVSKARDVLGFEAKVPLVDGLRRVVDWLIAEEAS